jgi:hypothetical protein
MVKHLVVRPIPSRRNPAAGQLQLLPFKKRKSHTMSQEEKFNADQTRRTNIEEISAVGNELSEEHLRMASGGFGFSLPGVGGLTGTCIAVRTYYGPGAGGWDSGVD